MNISAANQNNFTKALALIKECGLPTEDISDTTKLFVVSEENEITGTIGIELYNGIALLRSLAIKQERRSRGSGKQLVEFIERFAKQNGIKELVLLTTTAKDFFTKRAYQCIERSDIPEEIKQSTEFTSTCPSTAIVMKKIL